MNSFFTPPPEVIAFLTYKNTIYLPLLAVLSFLCLFYARRWERVWALFSLTLSCIGIFTLFSTALLPSSATGLIQAFGQYRAWASGLGMLLLPSFLFMIGFFARGTFRKFFDSVILLMLVILVVLWWFGG
jgi:hypothetical protein